MVSTNYDLYDCVNFNSIDNLVEYYHKSPAFLDHEVCLVYIYLLNHYPTIILRILKTTINKPSVHDLYIIKYISTILIFKEVHSKILDAYKYRKD